MGSTAGINLRSLVLRSGMSQAAPHHFFFVQLKPVLSIPIPNRLARKGSARLECVTRAQAFENGHVLLDGSQSFAQSIRSIRPASHNGKDKEAEGNLLEGFLQILVIGELP